MTNGTGFHDWSEAGHTIQTYEFGPIYYEEGTLGPRLHPRYRDDASAMLYYGTVGLLDPTNVGDIKFWSARGVSFGGAMALTGGRAFLGGAAIGWLFDPADKREGGIVETDFWQKRGPKTWVPRMKRNWKRMFD